MRKKILFSIVVFSLLHVFQRSIYAAEKGVAIEHVVTMSLAYSKCIDPETPACYAFSPDDKSKCPNCKEWVKGFVGQSAMLAFDDQEYSYDRGLMLPRANFMLKDAAKKLYNVEYPQTNYGYPIPVARFYKKPEKYGWAELSHDAPKAGALAIWPNIGGVVVGNIGKVGQISKNKVLYPSDKLRGRLNLIDPYGLRKEGKPKYIIPKIVLETGIQK